MTFTEKQFIDFFENIATNLKPINGFIQLDTVSAMLAAWKQSTVESPMLCIEPPDYIVDGVPSGSTKRKYRAAFTYAMVVDMKDSEALTQCRDELDIYIQETIAHIRDNSGDIDKLFWKLEDNFQVMPTPPLNNMKMAGKRCEFSFFANHKYYKNNELWQ